MSKEQSPICPNIYITNEGKVVACMAWMLEHPEDKTFLKCLTCGFCKKIHKRTIYIVNDIIQDN